MQVTLTPRQLRMGANHAVERKVESLCGEFRNHDRKTTEFAWRDEIEGTLAEMAVAEALKLPWTGARNWDAPADVGDNIQVRWAADSTRCLIIRPGDSDTDNFFLVTGELGVYQIHGWVSGAEGKNPDFMKAPNGRPPAFFVPQWALHRLAGDASIPPPAQAPAISGANLAKFSVTR